MSADDLPHEAHVYVQLAEQHAQLRKLLAVKVRHGAAGPEHGHS